MNFEKEEKWNGMGKSFKYNEYDKRVDEYEGKFSNGNWLGKGKEFENDEEYLKEKIKAEKDGQAKEKNLKELLLSLSTHRSWTDNHCIAPRFKI